MPVRQLDNNITIKSWKQTIKQQFLLFLIWVFILYVEIMFILDISNVVVTFWLIQIYWAIRNSLVRTYRMNVDFKMAIE